MPRRSGPVRIGITLGDPAGVGPEVVARSLSDPAVSGAAEFRIIGDAEVWKRACRRLRIAVPPHPFEDLQNVESPVQMGRMEAKCGQASLQYLDRALELWKSGEIDALVTAPLCKEAVNLSGVSFSGHTGYLARALGVDLPVMVLAGGTVRVILVTEHVPLREVPGLISKERIVRMVRIAAADLKEAFGLRRRRIAVCGLNPHAGEGGLLGTEDRDLVAPAVRCLKEEGLDVHGPFPSDGIFPDVYQGKYDAVVCMYHDQGLTPLKMVFRQVSVNCTFGLPFVRTSPAHGTAFDIAGKGKADPHSTMQAICTAADWAGRRRARKRAC
ncbi:MAG: 4-hydroxythreonine-4-phosphate dehydrogenase PdxA [Candidatus Omnitrophica bacterium]|nr:4-hydroxythreonine-4-phosphate dehydrogenase PdxA [Candidatus Omnitrophota bacterium]